MSYDRSLNIFLRLSGFSRETEPVGDTYFILQHLGKCQKKMVFPHIFITWLHCHLKLKKSKIIMEMHMSLS